MRKFTFVLKAIGAFLIGALFLSSIPAQGQCLPGALEGYVYLDSNFDGLNNSGETGKSGIPVRVFDMSGQQAGQAVSGHNGHYIVQGLTDGEHYRVVYDLPDQTFVSAAGINNQTDVSFVTIPFCDAELGVIEETSNCSENIEVFLTCFVNGLGTNSPGQETVVGLPHNFVSGSKVNVYATQAETGSVWGIAYKNTTQEIFTAAYVKQLASLTAHGHDAIFRTEIGDSPQTTLFARLSDLGQVTGSLTYTNPLNCNYGKQVGKMGLGALQIDSEEQFLYVTNLYNNTVVRIPTVNPTAATTTSFQVPNPGCSFNDYRVFALKFYRGDLYVGVTCTAETSGLESDASFHIYKMNVNTGNFTLIMSVDEGENVWDETKLNRASTLWLKDIEFTDPETMILGIADKVGDTFCNGATNRVDDQYGDILMAYFSNGQWHLENNGTTATRTGTGVGNGQGPGGGEFFGEDAFPKDPVDHAEVALGSLMALPYTNEVIAAVYDPLFNTYSGGLHRYNAINGRRIAAKELYNHNITDYFGKASGLGDITAGCGSLPVEIGNYAWIDSNENGLQDAGEAPLTGFEITLLDKNCQVVGTTVTDSKGNYSFNQGNVDLDGDGNMDGLIAGESYYLVPGQVNYDAATGAYIINSNYYYPTALNSQSKLNSDLVNNIDPCNDAGINAFPMIAVAATSGNDPGYDIGLNASTVFDLALRKTNTTTQSVKRGESVTFEIEVHNQGGLAASEVTIVDYLTDAYSFNANLNPGWTREGKKLRKTIGATIIPGAVHTEKLHLTVRATNNISKYTNVAEITGARDHTGAVASDVDSTPDEDAHNDIGGVLGSDTDDRINDDGTTDEDDHDPATTKVMDLALLNIIRDDRNYDIGEMVTFDMTIYNQGNITATTVEVTNQFTENLEFDPASNPGWTRKSGSTAAITYDQPIAPGESVTVSLSLLLTGDYDFRDIINYAEISAFTTDDPEVVKDFDSTPDADFKNDAGGDPYGASDNMIDDHGDVDEDDHDPAYFRVRLIDMALRKQVVSKAHDPGDNADFEITLVNQGDITIKSVMLVDYLPESTTLNDPNWTLDPSDPTGLTAVKNIIFTNGLAPGQEFTETIRIRIDENIAPGLIVNEAEIGQVKDQNGMDVSQLDVDSKADMTKGNDAGGGVNSSDDDKLDGNGIDDEDDHDPASLYVAAIDIAGSCDCLDNATDSFNGQFQENIVVTAPTGQTWNIDFAVGIFDPASAAPPAAPTPFTTGTGGYTLVENPLGDGTSEYTLEGIIIDNETYSIRVFNEDAAYLQISGGGSACSYNDLVILSDTEGLSAVCAGSIHTYGIQNTFGCDEFSWTLSGGGTIVGPSDEETITIEWGGSGGPYTLMLEPDCPGLCLSPASTSINVGLGDGAMACRQNINVSLGMNCSTEVDPELILTNPAGGNIVYQVMLLDEHGDFIPNSLLTEEHLWTTVTAKVIDPCVGNSCWSTILVEDKMPPVIQCDDIEMPCWQMDTYEPIVWDNCTDATYTLLNETITPIICDVDFIKEVSRTYIAEDEYGNVSEPCTQTITLERINLDSIVWPQDYLLLEGTSLSCVDSLFDEDGFPLLSVTGVPTLFGGDLYPVPDFYCNLGVDYDDFVVTEFGCVKKIMRTWTAYEAWCTVGQVAQWTQTIEITDMSSPVVTCPESVEISSDGGPGCTAEFTIELPDIVDDCSDEFEIDITYPGGFLDNVESAQTVTLDAGVNEIIYTVYDGCDNPSSCSMFVTVVDQSAPTPVCEQTTIVSLRSDGTAKAFAQTFDDGSFDDCGLFEILVRRMSSNCDCHVPVYDNMRYLGERNGRYYYLSNFKVRGFQAYAYSTAFGGFLATFEGEDEHNWVFDQADDYIAGNYYIGLSDVGHEGNFTWANHAAPGYNRWEGGAPVNSGDYVVTNGAGNWEVVDGAATEAYFVMEVSDPCTYSDEIHFCCEDVAEDQIVLLRAIDEFGQYNDCMVMVEVQDKVAPEIVCPPDMTIDCDTPYDLGDLSSYGDASATDVCGVTLSEVASDTINLCQEGQITRVFTASDLNGASTCTQIIEVINMNPFNPSTIIWPEDFESDQGCDSGDLHPDNLPFENAYPQIVTGECDIVAPTFTDQMYSFAGGDTSACQKILRTWTVIDWCAMDRDPFYEPSVYQQTIKITNSMGPEIVSGCDTLVVITQDCDFGDVSFEVVADDDCTPDNMLDARLEVDEDSDGDFDYVEDVFSNTLSFSQSLPVGEHFALASYADMCGNRTTCAKIIQVINDTPPTAACIQGLSVALVPMDLDDDGTPDTEMTCIFPEMVDASSTHICGFEINLSFSADTTDDKLIFDCADLGDQVVELWVTDEFGNTASCSTTVEVQDNNNEDVCPRFDLALIKEVDTIETPGPFMEGGDVTFVITVFNQGNMSAYNIELVDYIPEGLILNDPDWTESGGKATYNTPIAFLEDSTSTQVDITFSIAPEYPEFTITNIAEISFADSDTDPGNEPPEDADSTPDSVNNDPIGGDNIIDNTNGDEDDHDPATIDIAQFDLALTKVIDPINTPAEVNPGDDVTFIITVYNQGSVEATNVVVEDYLDPNMVFNAGDNSDFSQTGSTISAVISALPACGSEALTLVLQVADDFSGNMVINNAEITGATNSLGLIDEDDPLSQTNDGTTNELSTDNDIDDEFSCTPGTADNPSDEDDYDPALVEVVCDLAPVCVAQDVTVQLDDNGNGSLTAAEVDNGSAAQCDDSDVSLAIDITSFDCNDINMPQTVTLTVTDTNGTSSSCSATVTVEDDIIPVIITCEDVTVDYNDGNPIVMIEDVTNNSQTDNCGLTDIQVDLSGIDTIELECTPMMASIVATDMSGNTGTCGFLLTIANNPPEAICQDITIQVNGSGVAVAVASDVDGGSIDDCTDNLNLSLGISVFGCDDVGQVNNVVLTVTDESGQTDSCSASVTVEDNIPPTALCQDISVALGSDGMVTITSAQIDNGSSDNCTEPADLLYNIDMTQFDCDDTGIHTVTLTVTDESGLSDTCSASVTVVDNTPPTVQCAADFTISLDSNGEAVLVEGDIIVTSDDNCGVTSESIDISAFDCDDAGSTVTVTATVSDATGNTATCDTDVTIVDDTAPSCTITANTTIHPNEALLLSDFTIVTDDNCGVPAIDSLSPSVGFDCTMLGMQTVILTVSDASGNDATCSATVSVEDDTPPTALCRNRTFNLNASGVRTIGTSHIDNGSFDNCTEQVDLVLMLDITSFDCDDIGMNTVTLTVTDESGNSDTCTSIVTINDNMPPTVTCAADFTVSLDGNGEAVIAEGDIIVSSADNCIVASQVISPTILDCDDAGVPVVITATVTDGVGNTATCTTTVTAEDDSAPNCTITANNPIPPLQSLQLSDFTITTSDNCGTTVIDSISPSMGFDCSMLGTQTVILTVSDNNGNAATCSASVEVEDIVAPQCVPMDITVTLDVNGEATITASDVDGGSTAGCSGIDTLTVDPTFFACNDVGDNPVTLTITSNNGMTDDCTAIVTVVDDTPPVVDCNADITLDLNGDGEAIIAVADVLISSSDGCGILSETLDISVLNCADKAAPTTVTVTVSDMNGNTATCSTEVSVEDNLAPECTLLTGLQFVPDVTISVADVLDTATDNCAVGDTAITTQTEFTCSDVGFHTVEVLVQDTCGNSNTCTTEIEIIDDLPPVCMAQDITVSLDGNGTYSLDPSEVDNGSAAICGGGVTLEVDPDTFDCTELGDNVVTLTVTASGGESSTCTATVTLEDNMPPVIVCPADMTLACGADLTFLDSYGTASATDNCDNFPGIIEVAVFDVNACNVGTVVRTFTATDDEGNTSTCEQTIVIAEPVDPLMESDITWPDSIFNAGDCIANPDSIDSGFPVIDTSMVSCFNISITVMDFDPTPLSDGCNDLFERTFTVVDSCQLDGTGSGIFTFTQIVELNDSVGPMIMGPMDTIIYLDPNSTSCDTFINLPATVMDCIGGFSSSNNSPFADNNNGPDASGTYEGGETEVTITAVDTCGNESTYTYTVTVLDTSSAFVSCEKIIETIQPNMTAVVTTDQAASVIGTMCSDTIFTLSFSATSPNQDSLLLDCSDVGLSNYTIYLYGGAILIDSCTNLLQVLDGGGFCSSPLTGTIEGSIHTEDGRMVDEVRVDLQGSPFASLQTGTDGYYAFPAMAFGGSYAVVPQKNIDPMNGVSTLDLIRIQRHILGMEKLESPYQYIAADIDNSGSITTRDLLELRKLILGHYDAFPENTSWRMVDAGYKFADPYNPFLYDIPEDYEIATFDQSMDIDFIGVKVGDVNHSAQANAHDRTAESRSSGSFEFVVDDARLSPNDIHDVVFKAHNLDQVNGYQFTLALDTDKFDILGFTPLSRNFDMAHVNTDLIGDGIVHVSWNRLPGTEAEGEEVFAVTVRAREQAWISELSHIDATGPGIRAEAYLENGIVPLGINYSIDPSELDEFVLYQNQPNPWLESTDIRFYAPEQSEVELSIYDINGRLLKTLKHTAVRGVNKLVLKRSDIPHSSGILYYELNAGDTRLMEKMLLIK